MPSKFLVVSIALHLLFALGAAYLIVEVIPTKRKLTFQAGPRSPNPSTRAIEYKVQTAKRQQMTQVPMTAKRILSTGPARVSLPELPKMPETVQTTAKMMGAGGAGLGFSMDAANAGGTGGNVSVPVFGFRPKGGQTGLLGTFYDLKQDRNGKPTKMVIADQNWESSGGSAEHSLFRDAVGLLPVGLEFIAARLFFQKPRNALRDADFYSHDAGGRWPGGVQPREQSEAAALDHSLSGQGRSAGGWSVSLRGFCDDVLVVKFNGAVVLDAGYVRPSGTPRSKQIYVFDG